MNERTQRNLEIADLIASHQKKVEKLTKAVRTTQKNLKITRITLSAIMVQDTEEICIDFGYGSALQSFLGETLQAMLDEELDSIRKILADQENTSSRILEL